MLPHKVTRPGEPVLEIAIVDQKSILSRRNFIDENISARTASGSRYSELNVESKMPLLPVWISMMISCKSPPREPLDTKEDQQQGTADTSDLSDLSDLSDTGDTSDTVPLTGSASIAENPHNPFSAIVTVTVDQDAALVVEYGEGALTHATPAVSAVAGEPTEVLVLGLRADRTFQLEVAATHPQGTWRSEPMTHQTAPLETGWPVCTPTFTAPKTEYSEDEVVCTQGLTSAGTYMYFCTDYFGEPVLSIRTSGNDSLMSMRPLADGSWASTSFTAAKLILFSPAGEEIAAYSPSFFTGTRFIHEYIDSHEVIELQHGKWAGALVFFTNSYEVFENGSYKLGNGLIVFDPVKRTVLYDYNFHGTLGDQKPMDPRMPYSRNGNGDYEQDWTHANTILHGTDADGQEYFLLSLKSQDWLFKLYPDSDELAWAFGFEGDFTLVDDIDATNPTPRHPLEWAYHQHGMNFVEDNSGRLRLIMLDNGMPRHNGNHYVWNLHYSRMLEFRIDEETMLTDIVYEYGAREHDDPEWFFSATCGNALLLQDGARAMTIDGENATMIEASYPEAEERWRMECNTTEWCEYRVHWFPSLYETNWMNQ